jgi:hypothetical protein
MEGMLPIIVFASQMAALNAPADQYFGRFRMSALRIRYETMQLKKRYETHQLLPEQAEHLLVLTQDAFGKWSRAYPKDGWLPSTGYAIASLYAELPGSAARERAVTLYVYVNTSFPRSPYAAQSRTVLHRGITVKPDPQWAKERRATSVPSTSPSGAAAGPAARGSPSSAPGSPGPPW